MFENLSDRLQQAVNSLRGQSVLSEENIQASLRQVRMALLEADVALPVVKDFIEQVRRQAVGQQVVANLQPGQTLIKIVQEQLEQLMGASNESLDLSARPPAVVLMAGLQGSGKTTTVGKLARLLKERHGKRVMVASADVYRPAAIDQLERLAAQVEVGFFPSSGNDKPDEIAQQALEQAQRASMDVLIRFRRDSAAGEGAESQPSFRHQCEAARRYPGSTHPLRHAGPALMPGDGG